MRCVIDFWTENQISNLLNICYPIAQTSICPRPLAIHVKWWNPSVINVMIYRMWPLIETWNFALLLRGRSTLQWHFPFDSVSCLSLLSFYVKTHCFSSISVPVSCTVLEFYVVIYQTKREWRLWNACLLMSSTRCVPYVNRNFLSCC